MTLATGDSGRYNREIVHKFIEPRLKTISSNVIQPMWRDENILYANEDPILLLRVK